MLKDTSYQDELRKPLIAVLDKGEQPTIVISSSSGQTKTLNINLNSIEDIREFLDTVEHKMRRG